MAVQTTHKDYDAKLSLWAKARACVAGQDAVHAAGEIYLPKLSAQTSDQYKSYLLRTLFYNATGRTLDGMTGLIFRKPPVVEVSAGLQSIVDDVDMGGTPLLTFAQDVVEELIIVGRLGILIDYPPVIVEGMTVGQAQAAGLRPFAVTYNTESIINWDVARIDNRAMLTMVRLMESVEIPGDDEFSSSYVDQIRVLDLVNDGKTISYRVRLYRKNTKGDWEQFGTDQFPKMNNQPMSEIPFIFVSVDGLEVEVCKPPLADLVNVNLSHYRSTADYEHGLHFTGLPTPIFWGVQLADNAAINIGSGNGLVFSDPAGHAEYLEFQGAGLTQLKDALADKVQMMATLGARMLANDKRAVEAAETASIHRASENSVLASIAYSGSAALTKAINLMALWSNQPQDASIKLNTDYLPTGLSSLELTALTAALQSGSISEQTYFDNLVRGEIIQGTTFEQEQEYKAGQPPKLGTLLA